MNHAVFARSALVCTVAGLVLAAGCSLGYRKSFEPARSDAVGRIGAEQYLLPTGQLLTPAGRQVELPGLRPQALAMSPDGRWYATSGKTNLLVIVDAATGAVLQRRSLSTNKVEAKAEAKAAVADDAALSPELAASTTTTNSTNASSAKAQISFTGLVFSPDGSRLYLSAVGGDIRVFPVEKGRGVGAPTVFAVPSARAPKQRKEIPTGLAVSADSRRLYVAGNLGNRLHELDAVTGKVLRSWDTGVAPYDVVLARGKVYVSNQGGRRPAAGDLTGPAGKGMTVRVDPDLFLASEGSVTVIDLEAGVVKTELVVERHATGLAVSPGEKYVVVANTGSDTLSVIDTGSDQVVEKIFARQNASDLFGAQPNALAFDETGRRLFVCNGTQNAVAVVKFQPEANASAVVGLIPTGWFPGAVHVDHSRRKLCVANIRGIGSWHALKPGDKAKFSNKDFAGTLSMVPLPSDSALAGMTATALLNMRYPKLAEALLPPRPDQPARPVPERAGEPSLFKHFIYVIKENRTYDQILGDMPEGNGDTNLCVFGERYTPNQHKIAREFVLLDNTYCAGVQSADGHQWTDSAIANSYMERQVTSDFPRTYPGGKVEEGLDALAWSSSGFIWNNALAHKKTFRNYGEWMITDAGWRDKKRKDRISWRDFWNDYSFGSNHTRLSSHAGIETLRPHSPTNTVGWDLHVPDVMRAAAFIKDLHRYEAEGQFPNLVILFLPNDHTGGTKGRYPIPGAQLADNDLAFGQVVEAVTRSKFWPETCLMAIEDDPQAGWDHVSGYRTTCYVVSPYTKRRQTVSTAYNQTSLMRTLELILGLPPMNQMDASASPMTDCFTDQADLTPFTSVPNQFPLDQINPEPKKITDPVQRKFALMSEKLSLDRPDQCSEDLLNRILWHSMKPSTPYPQWAVKSVEDDD